MSKHTPGKWINRTAGDPTDQKYGMSIYAGSKLVATCHYGSTDTPSLDSARENAKLIAAAPSTAAERDSLRARVAELEGVLMDIIDNTVNGPNGDCGFCGRELPESGLCDSDDCVGFNARAAFAKEPK